MLKIDNQALLSIMNKTTWRLNWFMIMLRHLFHYRQQHTIYGISLWGWAQCINRCCFLISGIKFYGLGPEYRQFSNPQRIISELKWITYLWIHSLAPSTKTPYNKRQHDWLSTKHVISNKILGSAQILEYWCRTKWP